MSFRYLIPGLVWIAAYACGSNLPPIHPTPDEPADSAEVSVADPSPEPSPVAEYPGKTIDELFSPTHFENFWDSTKGSKRFAVEKTAFQLWVSGFAPVGLFRKGTPIVQLRTQFAKSQYWSLLIGRSHLLGKKGDELYVASSGPGGVCCTNYWIVDLSSRRPRLIFRSEQFGSFRDAMEIVDVDNDGIYELVQFDSCMRYFLNDCGSCSPEPRAYFKYDPRHGRYEPAKSVMEEFTKEQLAGLESDIAQQYDRLKSGSDPTLEFELRRELRSLVVQLLHLGQDKRAWKVARLYELEPDEKKEIIERLKSCKFYRALERQRE